MRKFSPLLLLGVAACTLGPQYAAQRPQTAATFARAEAPPTAAAAQWWRGFNDPLLDRLETQALAASPSVAAARAKLRQARALATLEGKKSLPSGSVDTLALRADSPSAGGVVKFYNLGFDASWELDLFGGQRRATEAERAAAEAVEADLADAQVSLTADVARAYVGLRGAQARLSQVQAILALQARGLELTESRARAGTASQLDCERLRAQRQATAAQIGPIQAERSVYLDALAVLTGQQPGSLDEVLAPAGPIPLPPASVAVGDPGALLSRRPDVRKAERLLARETASIGVAEASRFPKVSLMGVVGLGGDSLSDLTDLDALTTLALPRLTWNALDFGRGAQRLAQARGRRDEAEARYQGAILSALQDAEDALARFGNQRQAVGELSLARRSAARTAALVDKRQKAGVARQTEALEAERQRVEADQKLSDGLVRLGEDYVSLQKALGLGW